MRWRAAAVALAISVALVVGINVGAQNVANYHAQGGGTWVVGSLLNIISGGTLDVQSGSTFTMAGAETMSGTESITGTATVGSAGTLNAEAGTFMIPAEPNASTICVTGEVYIDTDETNDTGCTTTVDNVLCYCADPNTWVSNEL